jgi:hypothetical protein
MSDGAGMAVGHDATGRRRLPRGGEPARAREDTIRFGRSWAVLEPYGDPPFVTRFADRDGVVGRRFFAEWARGRRGRLTRAPAGAGILGSLDELTSDRFDAGEVHPLVRDVYERTSLMDFVAGRAVFSWHGWLWHFVYNRLVARGMQQLDVPIDPGLLPGRLETEIALLDEDRDGRPDHRIWIRSYGGTTRIFYVGAVDTHRRRGARGGEAYLDVVLPLWHANLTVVFQPLNLPHGGLALTTQPPFASDAGLYVVVPGARRFAMMPGLGMHEEIRVEPHRDRDGREWVAGMHSTTLGPLSMYRIPYTLARAAAAIAAAEVAAQATRPC